MDRAALTRVFTAMRHRLRLTAARIVGNSEADDALQDAFCRLWRNVGESTTADDAMALGTAAVRNRSIDMARRHGSHATTQLDEALTAAAPPADETPDTAERFARVRRIIERELPQRQREALWMRDYQGTPFAEIAQTMGLTEANVRQIVSRARKQVRDIYRRLNPEDYEQMV